MYKVQDLIKKGLQVEKLPADIQSDIETLKTITGDFSIEDADGHAYDDAIYQEIMASHRESIPGAKTEDELAEIEVEEEASAQQEYQGSDNPLIGDSYFNDHPEKVLGEQSYGGRHGTAIIVKGDKNNLKIDTPAVPKVFVKFSSESSASSISKEDIAAEMDTIIKTRKHGIRKKTKKSVSISEEQAKEPDVYTFREVSEFYNKNISREEIEAYLYENPILPFEKYIDEHKFTERDLVDKGFLFHENGKFIYKWNYVSGDIHKRMTYLKRDESLIRERYGDKIFENQMDVLNKNVPRKAVISLEEDTDNRIILSPISEFALTLKLMGNEISFVDKDSHGETEKSINEWFYQYLYFVYNREPVFFKGSSLPHCHNYVRGQKVSNLPESGKNVDKDEAAQNRKRNLEFWQRAKSCCEKLFNKFMFEELFNEAKMKVEILWNEKFNTFKSPELDKIPVGFTISKFIRKSYLYLNETQRESVAFINYNRSGLLGMEVGLGKTISALACISQAIENNLATKPLIIAPKNVYFNWIWEIEGNSVGEGDAIAGVLPHFPKVMRLGNCNEENVMKNKTYNEDEFREINICARNIETVKEQNAEIRKHGRIPDTLFETSKNPLADYARRASTEADNSIQDKITKLQDKYKMQLQRAQYSNQLIFNQLQTQLSEKISKLENSLVATFMRLYLKMIKEPYAYCVYMTGEFKNKEKGTIALATEESLKMNKIGCRNSSMIIERMFAILTGGVESGQPDEPEEIESEENIDMDEDTGEQSERDKAKMYEKIKSIVEARLGNPKIALEDLGTDIIIIDEAHKAKKVFPKLIGQVKVNESGQPVESIKRNKRGRMKRDAQGNVVMEQETETIPYELGSGSSSGIALNAFALTTYIQETTKTGNSILLTGTPFENDPLEIYSMLALSNYQRLVDLGYKSMKKFFETYMKIEHDYKVKLNGVEKALVLNGFQNLIQFRNVVRSIILHRTGEQANIERPEKIIIPYTNRGLLPEAIKEVNAMLMPTSEQTALIQKIEEFVMGNLTLTQLQLAETEKYMIEQTLKEQEELEKEAQTIEDEGQEGMEDYEKEEGEEKEEKKGKKKQKKSEENEKVINATLQIESEAKGTRIIQAFNLMRQVTFSPFALKLTKEAHVFPTVDELVSSSPKLQYILACVKSVKQHHEAKGTFISGQIIYSTVCKDFFPLIKEYLVKPEYGVNYKDDEVQVLTGDTSDKKKELYKLEFKSGKIKVLIASETIQVGANLQDNATVMYHLFYDWNPTDNEQINGRIWRQGNHYRAIRIVYPMVENSIDQIVFQYLGEKTMRIKDVWDIAGIKSQLDLSEFDPNKMKLAALTDPMKKARFYIQIEKENITDEINYLRSKADVVKDIPGTIKNFYESLDAAVEKVSLFFTCLKNFRLAELSKKRAEDIEDLNFKKSELNAPVKELTEKMDDELAPLRDKIGGYESEKQNLDSLLKIELTEIKSQIGDAGIEGDDALAKKLREKYKDAEKNFKKEQERSLDKQIDEMQKTITAIENKYKVKIDKLNKEIEEKLAAIEAKVVKVEEKYNNDVKAVESELNEKINKPSSKTNFPSFKEYLTYMSYQSTYVIKWCKDPESEGRMADEMNDVYYKRDRYIGDLENFKNYKGQYEKIKMVFLDPMGIAEEDAANLLMEIKREIAEKETDLENIEQKFQKLYADFHRDYEERLRTAKPPVEEAQGFASLNFLLDERVDIEPEPEPVPEPEIESEPVKAEKKGKTKIKKVDHAEEIEFLKTKIEIFEMAMETADEEMQMYLETKIEIFKDALAHSKKGTSVKTLEPVTFAKGGIIVTNEGSLSSYVDLVEEGLMPQKQFVKFMHDRGMYIMPRDVYEQIYTLKYYSQIIEVFEYNKLI
jgi:hypothetical protein